MFDSTIGRFLSEDPLGFLAGDTNLARYVGNHPTYAIDPDGLAETKPLNGTKENRYTGLGEWELSTDEKADEILRLLLDPEKNDLPPNWVDVIKRGCVGLATIRIGWGDTGRPPLGLWGTGNFTMKGVSIFLQTKRLRAIT